MEIELSHVFDAEAARLWSVLLDPERMSRCVPGMQSVEVVSDSEYRATIKVKIAFISAKFNVRTVITEMTPPTWLVCECSGEDNAVGSSVKSRAEMWLTEAETGGTELRVKAKADVLGRLGSLGLNPMRTKAERMWDEFCANVEAQLASPTESQPEKPEPRPVDETPQTPRAMTAEAVTPGLFERFRRRWSQGDAIRVEVRRADTTVVLYWPPASADKCLSWLDRQLGEK